MVDPNKINERSGSGGSSNSGSKSSSSSSSSGSSSGGSSGGESTDPFVMEDDMVADASGVSVSDTSKNWADEYGEFSFDVQGGENLKQYVSRQIDETREFYENITEISKNNVADANQFAIYFHALMMNLARNREGIMNVLQSEFGKSEKESLRITKKICREAGEIESMVSILDVVTRRMEDMEI